MTKCIHLTSLTHICDKTVSIKCIAITKDKGLSQRVFRVQLSRTTFSMSWIIIMPGMLAVSSSSLTWWLGTGTAASTFTTTRTHWRTERSVAKMTGESSADTPRARWCSAPKYSSCFSLSVWRLMAATV